MKMKVPPHPGLSVRFDCIEALGLSVTAGAKVLGVTRQALNNLVNEKAGISPEMAIRLDKAFGGTAEAWLALQAAYDLAQVRRKPLAVEVKRYVARTRSERPRPGVAVSNPGKPQRSSASGSGDVA
jgi:addiction module HigA family antidote